MHLVVPGERQEGLAGRQPGQQRLPRGRPLLRRCRACGRPRGAGRGPGPGSRRGWSRRPAPGSMASSGYRSGSRPSAMSSDGRGEVAVAQPRREVRRPGTSTSVDVDPERGPRVAHERRRRRRAAGWRRPGTREELELVRRPCRRAPPTRRPSSSSPRRLRSLRRGLAGRTAPGPADGRVVGPRRRRHEGVGADRVRRRGRRATSVSRSMAAEQRARAPSGRAAPGAPAAG